MNIAIIVAAGSGKRFGSETPKQFLDINGKPLLFHTLEKFENCAAIDQYIVVLPSEEFINYFHKISENTNFPKLKTLVTGGDTRAESVWNGLQKIDETTCEIVAVHDGVRPFVTSEEISKTIEKANGFGAACLVAPVTDTIKRVENGKIAETINRNTLKLALTPQAFRFEIIKRAYENADLTESATDDCFLVEKAGYEISFIEGSARNIKITHAEDLALAKFLLGN